MQVVCLKLGFGDSMEVQTMAYRSLIEFKPSPVCAMSTVLSRRNSAYSRRNSLRTNAAHSRIGQCGAHEPSSSYYCLSSNSMKPIPSRASFRLVVRSGKEIKGKESKGKKKGGKGGGGGGSSKGELAKKAGPRPNVWSKDIAETEYQASRGEAKPSRSKQQGQVAVAGREVDVRGKGGDRAKTGAGDDEEFGYQDFGDDYTGVLATGGIPVEILEVLQAQEQMPNPLWPTFVSSNAGVWRGYGAAFSPITGEMEPVALDVSKAYLYDAAVLCSVESIPGAGGSQSDSSSLYRKVMWTVGNTRGERGYKEYQEDLELFGDDLEDDEDLAVNPIELESSAIAEGMNYPLEAPGEEFGTVEDTKEFLQGLGPALYNPEKENPKDWALRESDPEWESIFKAGMVDSGLVEELKNVPTEAIKVEDVAPANSEVWKDVMEEDTMTLEPGLVFFSDGSYSRGPVSLLPDDLGTTEPAYFNAPTFKIEQCIVTGKHRRLRLVHTIAIMESGEEIQVLRVALYEEQWTGPRNMESISESTESLAYLLPFSQRDRPAVNELTGSWKVFEMSAIAIHQPDASLLARPAYGHFCQEFVLKQGLPGPLKMYLDDENEDAEPAEDPVVLWLPGGITASVEAKEDGVLTVGVGWFYEDGTFLSMERDYGPDGKLSEVRSQTKVKGGWAGGRM